MDEDIIYIEEIDSFNDTNMRRRSKTWSFATRPGQSNEELSIDDIYNELKQSASKFINNPKEVVEIKYEDLSDIDEDDQSVVDKNHQKSKINEPMKRADFIKLCGFPSYKHMIEEAINSSHEKQLTLNQIYEWIEENIPYFRALNQVGNGHGWKNSVVHNLSIHKQFFQVLRDGHRSCSWACDMKKIKHDKVIKNRKVCYNSQPSISSFRSRSKTEPTMVRPLKPIVGLRLSDEENLSQQTFALSSYPYQEKIKQTSLENIAKIPEEILKERCRNISTNYSISLNDVHSKERHELNRLNDTNNAMHQLNIQDPMFKFNIFNTGPQLVLETNNSFCPDLKLDDQAIIEHEKRLYKANFQ